MKNNNPAPRVYEFNNGVSHLLKFYRGERVVDVINLNKCNGIKLPDNILTLEVVNFDDERVLGTVYDRLSIANRVPIEKVIAPKRRRRKKTGAIN